MQNHLNKINGKTLRYCGLLYKVLETKMVNYKAVIKTDRQTFVKTQSELDAFMEDIEEFIKEVPAAEKIVNAIMSPKKALGTEVYVPKSSPLQAEIIQAESTAQKVSDKLMEVFNLLSESPTEEVYKKANAMVNVSNSIVNVQMAQIKFLTLKK